MSSTVNIKPKFGLREANKINRNVSYGKISYKTLKSNVVVPEIGKENAGQKVAKPSSKSRPKEVSTTLKCLLEANTSKEKQPSTKKLPQTITKIPVCKSEREMELEKHASFYQQLENDPNWIDTCNRVSLSDDERDIFYTGCKSPNVRAESPLLKISISPCASPIVHLFSLSRENFPPIRPMWKVYDDSDVNKSLSDLSDSD